ncbi:hypothetical protein FHQ08_03310 [Lactobacillus sp. CC-MHH1034]|nr:hypothetical protein [Agrilactobacillus fermenti]
MRKINYMGASMIAALFIWVSFSNILKPVHGLKLLANVVSLVIFAGLLITFLIKSHRQSAYN